MNRLPTSYNGPSPKLHRDAIRNVAVFLALVGGVMLWVFLDPPSNPPPRPRATTTTEDLNLLKSALPTRGEFKRRIMGRCESVVIELVGRPDRTQTAGDREYWYFRGRTIDSVTGNIDRSAQVVFETGCVTGVNFD